MYIMSDIATPMLVLYGLFKKVVSSGEATNCIQAIKEFVACFSSHPVDLTNTSFMEMYFHNTINTFLRSGIIIMVL